MKKYLWIIIAIVVFTAVFGFYIIKSSDTDKITGDVIKNNGDYEELTLKVSIPCPGHASLIEASLQKLGGIKSINFRIPNLFDIYYDTSQLSKEDILDIEIFNKYPVKIIN